MTQNKDLVEKSVFFFFSYFIFVDEFIKRGDWDEEA